MTEFSVGVNIDGKEMDIPTIVPTLSKNELEFILNIKDGEEIPNSIIDKAVEHAKKRISQNKSVFADPEPITSRKGAIGIAQIMPDTGPEAAKLAGLPWDEQRFRTDAEYNKALGKAYFAKQLQDFDGDLSKAYAAYNAGPGALRNALKLAESTGLPWSGFLPDETQAYVAKNMKAFAAGQGQYQRPTLADAQQTALDKLGPNPSAELVKLTMDVVEKHYNDQTKAIKQRQEEATGNAMRMILENGGDFAGLPPQVRGSVPIEDVDKVMAFAKKINAREPIETDWGLYYRMKSNPQLLKDTNLMAFRDKLSDSEFKGLSEEQQQLNNRNSSMTSVRSPKQILDQFMLEAGIDPSPKAGSKDAEKVGRLWAAYEQQVGQAEQDTGKKLSNEELRQVAARLFVDVQLKRSFWFDETRPAGLIGSDELKNIVVPAAERQAIIDAWNQAGRGRAITENDIVTMYARRQGLL
ncbi:hypothetical protein C2U68_17335 [Methylomonas koyamae]|nr:hypothetical protein C2U68_17335 [Methylomonas koyamae]